MSAERLTSVKKDPNSRIEALKAKHNILKMKIVDARKSLSVTDFYLNRLKKEKLAVKEQIENVRQEEKS